MRWRMASLLTGNRNFYSWDNSSNTSTFGTVGHTLWWRDRMEEERMAAVNIDALPVAADLQEEVRKATERLVELVPACRKYKLPGATRCLHHLVSVSYGGPDAFVISMVWTRMYKRDAEGAAQTVKDFRMVTLDIADTGMKGLLSGPMPSACLLAGALSATKTADIGFGSIYEVGPGSWPLTRRHAELFIRALKDGLNVKIRQIVLAAEDAENAELEAWNKAHVVAEAKDKEMADFLRAIY